MAKKVEEGTKPAVSKYAAKKAARIAANAKDNVENDNENVTNVVEDTTSNDETTLGNKPAKNVTIVGKEKREINIAIPKHIMELAYIVKDNAAIRRHCSLNIINYLTQKGRIPADASGKFVKFLWNKFRVSANGLTSEYSYKEEFFLKALISSFSQFAKDAQTTISIFMNEEGIGDMNLGESDKD